MVDKLNSNLIKIDIPPVYMHITKDIQDRERRGNLFKRYVIGYLAVSYPELRLIKIEGMKAICEKR
jgi:hypothetical protein